MKKRIVFVDFDGTITAEDTLVGCIRLFVPEREYLRYERMLAQGETTLSIVVRKAFEGAPSNLLPKMLDYVKSVPLRKGFEEFLDEMDKKKIPVVVISGGMRQFSELRLKPYLDRFAGFHAVDLDVSGPKMKVISPYDNGDELLAKTKVMALYDYDYAVGIGDSFTDRNMAKAADAIFARDDLALYLQKLELPYIPYSDFFDVIRNFPEV